MPVFRTKDGALTERVARALLGAPSGIDPETGQVKFGDISVNIVTGRFFDFDDETSGTHIELIQRFKNVQNGQAEAWLKENITEAKPLPLSQVGLAERALIGMLSMRPDLLAAVEEEVTVDHFGEMLHKQLFAAIAAADHEPGKPVSMKVLMAACGGDPLLPVVEGFTLARYVAAIVAEAPSAPDVAHLARTLAAEIRSAANRDGDVQDEYDVEPEPAPWVPKFKGVRFEDIDSPGPEHSYVIDDWISEGGKFVIGGASLSGKSFLAIHMAMCIATGGAFFGNKIMKTGLVIYQAGEGETGIRKRFRAWRQHFGVKKGQQVPVYIIEQKIDIFNPNADTAPFIEEISGISRTYNVPLRAIFIDTLAKASIGADENSGKDMGVVMSNIDRIHAAFPQASTGLVHHLNAGGTKLRGHTSVYANVDQVVLVTREEDSAVKTATLDKQKDGESGLQIPFELFKIELGRRPVDGKPITSCVPLPVGAKLEMRVKGKFGDRTMSLSDQNANILAALKKAMGEHGEALPPMLQSKLPRSITAVVLYKHWREAFEAVAFEKDPRTVRKAMERAGPKFLRLGIIGRDGNYVWLTGRAANSGPEPLQGGTGLTGQTQGEFEDEMTADR